MMVEYLQKPLFDFGERQERAGVVAIVWCIGSGEPMVFLTPTTEEDKDKRERISATGEWEYLVLANRQVLASVSGGVALGREKSGNESGGAETVYQALVREMCEELGQRLARLLILGGLRRMPSYLVEQLRPSKLEGFEVEKVCFVACPFLIKCELE
ncbi:MAG: hypothetical protein GF381_04625, partial [Candidatus Pacebacteria bacterium]|nr:hypothetical protein [Candidatus Paceibacterota bacterium]